MIAMLLAGGQGSRLGVLTVSHAKPAVSFGGKYRLIDFPMSNCINSGVDTVGVLTQYQPLSLNKHIGIGIPWDLDRKSGGVTILAPHVKGERGEWYTGSANAVYQNIDYISSYDPDYVLVLGGDHIYKMDYTQLLEFHKKNNSDLTIPVLEVPYEEASDLGIMSADEDGRIFEFEEKPKNPKSNLASMGMYIFTWQKLKAALIEDNRLHSNSDFGKHIIPLFLAKGDVMYAYRFTDYWKDVGTIESYWQANMELIKTLPDFNLYEDFWKIYTDAEHQPPQYTGPNADVKTSLVSEGCEVYGRVHNSVLGPDVVISEGAEIYDSIIMEHCVVGENTHINRSIIDQNTTVGANVSIGYGDNVPNELRPDIYNTGITVIGIGSVVPDGVTIGSNCVIHGTAGPEHFDGGVLASGKSILTWEGTQ